MPAVLFHQAAIPDGVKNDKLFCIGNLLPDLFKEYFGGYLKKYNISKCESLQKIKNILEYAASNGITLERVRPLIMNIANNDELIKKALEDTRNKYYSLPTMKMTDDEKNDYLSKHDIMKEMPPFEMFISQLLEDASGITLYAKRILRTGLHYGETYELNVPHFEANPVLMGIRFHLFTDRYVYTSMDINRRMMMNENEAFKEKTGYSLIELIDRDRFIEFFNKHPELREVYSEVHQNELRRVLRSQWDRLNPYLMGKYQMTLQPMIEELSYISYTYSEPDELTYADPYVMLYLAEQLRSLDPMSLDDKTINEMIAQVDAIVDNNAYSEFAKKCHEYFNYELPERLNKELEPISNINKL